MDLSFKKLESSRLEMNFKVSLEEFNSYINKIIQDLGRSTEIAGFRKGKAPKEEILRHFGQEKIIREAALEVIKDDYIKAVKEKDIKPVGQPQLEILKLAPNNPLEFRITVSILPSIELPDYKEIAAETKRKEIKLDPQEVEETLRQLQKSRAKFSVKESPCQKGDWVNIEMDIEPDNDKEKIDLSNPKVKDSFILGQGRILPEIEKKIEGMKRGETKNFSFTYPKDYYQRNLAGKKVKAHLKLISVQKVTFPEITDEFAKSLGKFENLDKLKESIREGIIIEKNRQESQRIQQEILSKVAEKVNIEIPEILIKSEEERMLKQLKDDVSSQLKIKFEDYLKQINKTQDELMASFLPVVKKRIKEFLVLKEIGKKEKIEIKDKEVDDEINRILGQQSPLDSVKTKSIDPQRLKEYTKERMFSDRTLKRLESYINKN